MPTPPAFRSPHVHRERRHNAGVGVVGLVCAVLAALAYGAGSVAQSAGVRDPGAGAGVARLVRSPLYLLGLGLDGLGFAGSLVALRALPVFAVQSVLATSLAVTVVLARVSLHASLRRTDAAAVVVAAVACAVTASAAGTGPARPPATGFVVGSAVGAGLLLLAGLVIVVRHGPSWLLAAVSGVAFSVQVLAARGLSLAGISVHHPLHALGALAAEPLAWTLVVAGVTGIVLYGLALESGGVAAATAILWVVEIVVPTVCGIAFLGDTVRPGWAAGLVVALVAAITAAIVLARSPAQV